jgi:hypothetical protein
MLKARALVNQFPGPGNGPIMMKRGHSGQAIYLPRLSTLTMGLVGGMWVEEKIVME